MRPTIASAILDHRDRADRGRPTQSGERVRVRSLCSLKKEFQVRESLHTRHRIHFTRISIL